MSLENWHAVAAIFVFRLANAFLTATFFQPDEYFQALEPAHNLVYGYGYTTWEWHQHLRSAIHPLLYAAAYAAARPMGLRAVDWAPKVVSAAIAAAVDIGTYRLAWRVTHSPSTARTALLMSLASAWNWHVLPRLFLNNLEAALTTVALAQWPWRQVHARRLFVLCLCAGISCVVRPTNALVWVFLGAGLVHQHMPRPGQLARLVAVAALAGAVAIALGAAADRVFYRQWTFPLWNFVEFNVVRNLLVFYGSAPWHFYVGQGLPLMLMGYLPFFAAAVARSLFQGKTPPTSSGAILTRLTRMVVFVAAAFLAIAHKEWRFLQPLYPVMLVVAASEFTRWRAPAGSPRTGRARIWRWAVPVVLVHAAVAVFFSRVNERGVVDLVHSLRADSAVHSIGVLAPCHSTPWHATLHRPSLVSQLWFLTCEPPLHLAAATPENMRQYRDELDRFFDNPAEFLAHEVGTPARPWPSHLVVFAPSLRAVLDAVDGAYYVCDELFNSYFHWDPRRAGNLIVLCKAKAHAMSDNGDPTSRGYTPMS